MKPKTVIVIAGLPTAGKTSLGRALSLATNVHFVDIDEGPASCAPPQESNPYGSEESRARERSRMAVAYTILHAAVEENLKQGFSVIVSATYSRPSSQEFLSSAVERGCGNMKLVLCKYNDTVEEVERRIQDRIARGAVGGCRSVDHYFEDKSRYADIKLPHIVVMIEGGEEGLNRAIGRVLSYIE